MRISDWSSDVCSSDLEPSDKEKAGKCRPIFVRNFLLLLGRHRQKVEIMWVDCGHRTGLHRADERFWQEVDKIDIFDREPVPGFVLDFIKKHVWHRIVFDGAEMNANTFVILDRKSTRLNSSH